MRPGNLVITQAQGDESGARFSSALLLAQGPWRRLQSRWRRPSPSGGWTEPCQFSTSSRQLQRQDSRPRPQVCM